MRNLLPSLTRTLLFCGSLIASCYAQTITELQKTFADPPGDARPMMRWWWFGPAVADPELSRELHVMQQTGLGGVEIQPVYPLALDDPAHGIRNLPYLSPGFLAAVRFANTTARSLGLRTDITLGSGWPYGGPGTTLALSAGRLKLLALPTPATLPAPAAGTPSSLPSMHREPRSTGRLKAQRASYSPRKVRSHRLLDPPRPSPQSCCSSTPRTPASRSNVRPSGQRASSSITSHAAPSTSTSAT